MEQLVIKKLLEEFVVLLITLLMKNIIKIVFVLIELI